MRRTCCLTLTILCLFAARAIGDEPAPKPEPIPAPRVLQAVPAPAKVIYVYPPDYPEFGRRSVWQFYGVDRTGRFRPLVVQSPYGAYYRYDLSPYPWSATRQGSWSGYIVD
jgi:hypothetical protein